MDGIFEALRTQFEVTALEATTCLTNLRKAEHGAEVKKLVDVAYPDVPVVHRQQIGLYTFYSKLGSAYLQRHLLEVVPGPEWKLQLEPGTNLYR